MNGIPSVINRSRILLLACGEEQFKGRANLFLENASTDPDLLLSIQPYRCRNGKAKVRSTARRCYMRSRTNPVLTIITTNLPLDRNWGSNHSFPKLNSLMRPFTRRFPSALSRHRLNTRQYYQATANFVHYGSDGKLTSEVPIRIGRPPKHIRYDSSQHWPCSSRRQPTEQYNLSGGYSRSIKSDLLPWHAALRFW